MIGNKSDLHSLPRIRVVILGAGKNKADNLPSAMVNVDNGHRVLDWLLEAFSVLPMAQVLFVGGYKANLVEEEYPNIRFLFNSEWAKTGPVKSLSLVPLCSSHATYVCYSDIVFRQEIINKMAALEADIVLAVDSQWKERYEGRSKGDIAVAEKIIMEEGSRITDIGKHISSNQASAEFAGLLKLSGPVSFKLQNLIQNKQFSPQDGIPEIIRFFLKNEFTIAVVDDFGDWAELNAPQDLARFILGTKADSLERLRPMIKSGIIGVQVSFTLEQWEKEEGNIFQQIQDQFGQEYIIVRSSSLREDNWVESSAGAFTSVLDVPGDNLIAIKKAINLVIDSYDEKNPKNQVLVQKMLTNVINSGVVMTRTPSRGAPYYSINFDNTTSRTDTVTSGEGNSLRTIFLHHESSFPHRLPVELSPLMTVVKELVELVGHDSLDIEYAVDLEKNVYILQVRPITIAHQKDPIGDEKISLGIQNSIQFFRDLQKKNPFLAGSTTSFSVMSDWNPAEMIGAKPNRLAFSLYRYLITDETWAQQRAEYGYRDVRPSNLIVDFLGHPYIDLRVCFNSFTPANLSENFARKLVDHYLLTLKQHPNLHDKVEFEILFTCLGFDFDLKAEILRKSRFSEEEIEELKNSLRRITRRGMERVESDMNKIRKMEERYDAIMGARMPDLERVFLLLEDIRSIGIPCFSHLARNGFVAVTMLKSLASIGITTKEETETFITSIHNIPSMMQEDAEAVNQSGLSWNQFLKKYGHLRPGSYDITSACYASSPEEFLRPLLENQAGRKPEQVPVWNKEIRTKISQVLQENGFDGDVKKFEQFLRKSIEGREFGKFIFTKNLNASLEILVKFGANNNLSKEEMSHIRIRDFFQLRRADAEKTEKLLQKLSQEGKEKFTITQSICLPSQIFSESDFYCIEQPRSEPNFVTQKKITAELLPLSGGAFPKEKLSGKIIMIPNADPGFDWIFSYDIAGLITMYGGVNSHMAIRVAEFKLPAAIGVGETLFKKILNSQMIELDCSGCKIDIIR
jgi:glutamine kinase